MKKRWISVILAATMLCAATLPVTASGEETTASSVTKNPDLIYEETFDYADVANHKDALAQLGWEEQNKSMGAYADPTAKVAISGRRLAVTGSSDTYYLMLSEEDMADYAGKAITIQYDVEYTTATNTSRYFCILGNYAGRKYNSFHFRNSGTGNNQVHYDGSWYNYDAYSASTDAFAPATDTQTGSSIAMKILGKAYNSSVSAFSGIPVTIRYVLDPEAGTAVYMKKAEEAEDKFVLVSVHDPNADGGAHYQTWQANAICVKIGGAQNGYMDNIAVWLGTGDYPQPIPVVEETDEEETPVESSADEETETPAEESVETEKPKKVREPQTIVNKIAVWAVALFGGWIILKKEKEKESDDSKK